MEPEDEADVPSGCVGELVRVPDEHGGRSGHGDGGRRGNGPHGRSMVVYADPEAGAEEGMARDERADPPRIDNGQFEGAEVRRRSDELL